MLAEFGCRYAIVGTRSAGSISATRCDRGGEGPGGVKAGSRPIACVGETLAEREQRRDGSRSYCASSVR
jgi:triosephosphate isomerase